MKSPLTPLSKGGIILTVTIDDKESPKPMISKRTQEMTSFIVMDVLEKACEMECLGRHIIHLEVGEPDFNAPECVKEAAGRALADGFTHYTHSLGLLELREAICEYYDDTYRVKVEPDQILVSSGTSPVMFMVFSALLESGDEVIISDPHYACYPNFIQFFGEFRSGFRCMKKTDSSTGPKRFREKFTARTRAIFINSPANPTGNLLDADRMKAIADLSTCRIGRDLSRPGL